MSLEFSGGVSKRQPDWYSLGCTLNQQPSDTVAGERSPGLPGANLTPDRIVPADAPTTPAQVASGETEAACYL